MKSKNKTNMKKINKIIAERENTNFKYVDLDNQFGWKWDNEKLQFFQDNTIFIIYLLYSILLENKIFTCSKSIHYLQVKFICSYSKCFDIENYCINFFPFISVKPICILRLKFISKGSIFKACQIFSNKCPRCLFDFKVWRLLEGKA